MNRIFGLAPQARSEWRHGWPAVCAGLVGAAAAQIHFASLGVFIKPISESTHWSSATVTFGIFICSIVAVPGTPFAGWLAQRFGLAKVFAFGLPLFFLAFAGIGLFSHSSTQWMVGWTLLAIVGILVKSNIWMLWIAQKFDAARGMAFAALMSGAGLMAIFIPIATQMCIEAFGWRLTYPILAGAMATIAIVACIFGIQASPPAPGERERLTEARQETPAGLTIRQAIHSRAFWQIGIIAFLIGAGLVSLQVHMVPMFQAKGLDARTAAVVAGMFGGSALIGRFIAGAFLDRYSARIIGMISLLLPASACLIFSLFPVGPSAATLIAVLFGLGVGAEGDVLGYITGKYFGVRSFGTIYGAISGLFSLGAGVGPLAMSLLLDNFGSYTAVTPILFVMLLVCAALFATLGRYPQMDENGLAHDEPGSSDAPVHVAPHAA